MRLDARVQYSMERDKALCNSLCTAMAESVRTPAAEKLEVLLRLMIDELNPPEFDCESSI
jgi:hypothetical protein